MPEKKNVTSPQIEIVEDDITMVTADAIVNAANTDLLLGAGVAGAIRTRGGDSIQEECNRLAPVPLGGAAVTGAGKLPKTRHIIHAAAMRLGESATAKSVRDATRNALEKAEEIRAESLAMPALGMGIGGLDLETGAREMINVVRHHHARQLRRVIFVLFPEPAEVFRRVLEGED